MIYSLAIIYTSTTAAVKRIILKHIDKPVSVVCFVNYKSHVFYLEYMFHSTVYTFS